MINTLQPGNMGMTTDGRLWVTGTYPDGQVYPDHVHTSGNSTFTQPVTPLRAIDTRHAANRTRILNPSGTIDSSGRVIGGHTIYVDLSDVVYFGVAAIGNLTVVSPTAPGFVTLYPYNTARPATSRINFQTTTLSNAYLCGLGYDGVSPSNSVLSIYVLKTAAVILDVTASVVVSPDDVLPTAASTNTAAVAGTPTRQQLREQGTRPWQK